MTNTIAYPFGNTTLGQLERIYNNYGVASICCGDDKGFYVEADHLIKHIKKEA